MPRPACFAIFLAAFPFCLSASEQSLLYRLPFLSWFTHETLWFNVPAPPRPPCLVEPLTEISDLEALDFELAAGTSGVINTAGLTPKMSRALTRFEKIVLSAGGRFVLTSAYRPAVYQAHLQEIWDKWMLELSDNYDEECAGLRTEVEQEFLRHGLLETQRPATFSDHTLGLSFDAAVLLPGSARYRRRKATVDSLARLAGLRRPARTADPVHFRLM